jgi:hypothetical protein
VAERCAVRLAAGDGGGAVICMDMSLSVVKGMLGVDRVEEKQ